MNTRQDIKPVQKPAGENFTGIAMLNIRVNLVGDETELPTLYSGVWILSYRQ